MTFKNIITDIESLAPLSNTAFMIQQIYSCSTENIDIIKLVKIIEDDAALTANILKMINAPIFGFSKKIASVSQAVTLFGTDIIYGLVLKYSAQEQLKADTSIYGIDNKVFNDVCQLQSNLMLQWYSKIDLRHAQLMAPLALIMESGKLVLANEVMKSNYIKKFTSGYAKSENIAEFEHKILGTTTYYISAMLFEHWNLEPLYVKILKGLDFETDSGEKIESFINSLDVIRVAVNLKSVLTKKSIKEASFVVEDLGFDVDHFVKVANRVRAQYDKVLINRMKKTKIDSE